MGQRANLIIFQYGKYELFYTHWAANTLDRDLFWSPEFATAFIQMQRKVDESGWLDEVWAEGGTVVDWDKKVFLFFGGESILWDVPLRRLYLKLLAAVWQGWSVRWAYEGIADIADYVNYPRSKVLREYEPEFTDYEYDLAPPDSQNWTDIVVSVTYKDGIIGLFPLETDLEVLLESGVKLVEKIEIQRSFSLSELNLGEWTKEFPKAGLHLDFKKQTLEFWSADGEIDTTGWAKQYWSGWSIRFRQDRFEFQIEKTQRKLGFPERTQESLIAELRQGLVRENNSNPVDGLLDISERDRQEGKKVEINPWALRYNTLSLGIEEKERIFQAALEKI